MTKKRDKLILDTIDANGCLAFPFTLLGITFSENTAYGAAVKKLAADNRKSLCSALEIQKTVLEGCKLGDRFSILKDSDPYLYNLASNNDCSDNTVYICGISENEPIGACLDYEPKSASLGFPCECI